MDCNKGEAIRARDIALKKMESRDFLGARAFAVKAQKLYPDVQNVEQMILVCDVHCCAEKNGYTNQRDCFKILKCEPTDDDDSIKKQYRIMALMLHPDKNRFPGAADAFQLIREAKNELLNKGIRSYVGSKLNSELSDDGELEEWKSWISKEFTNSSSPTAGNSSECGLNEVKRSRPVEEKANARKKRMRCSKNREVGDNADENGFGGDGAKFGPNLKRSKNGGSFVASAQRVDIGGKSGDNFGSNFRERVNEVEKSVSFDEVRMLNENKNKGKDKEKLGAPRGKEGNSAKCYEFSANLNSGIAPEQTILEYSSSEFTDFEKERMKNCFKNGQVWASYDTLDAMPRFYALVNKIITEDFKIQITWLEPYTDNETELQWLYQGLPVSCGKFLLGETETIQVHTIFSHLVIFQTRINGSNQNFYEIFPRKGETWAVFKNWHINWHCDPKRLGNWEFELVEILSDYDSSVGVKVAFLRKIKGFASLFKRLTWKQSDFELVPIRDMLRFSHKVPSIQMTGNERPDAPNRCFELDPGSLPPSYTGISDFSPEPEPTTIIDSEFHNFNAEKSPENIKIGQIWAAYSDEDYLPRSYGLVKKVNTSPKFTLHVVWLVPSPQPHGSIGFLDQTMPISCGKFKLKKFKKGQEVDAPAISHQVKTETKENEYIISPQKGEVWALYKPWNPKLTPSELLQCEYEILEILEANEGWVEAVVLEEVKGYKLVYKPQNEGQEMARRLIQMHELSKFSHQIPAFKLTGERGGIIRGFWELDPAAVPAYLLT